MSTPGASKFVPIHVQDTATGKPFQHQVFAEVIGPFAIHAPLGRDDGHPDFPNKGRSITHLASGFRVFVARSQTSARRAIATLKKVADWNFTDPQVVKSWPKDVHSRIKAVREKAQRPLKRAT